MATDRADARIELIERGWQAYNSGDVASLLAIFSPDIVSYAPATMANAGTFHGHDGFIEWIRSWNEAWDSFSAQLLEVETVGERHLVTLMNQRRGTGRGSGVEVEMRSGWVYETREGLCVYLAIHPSLEEARADAERREAESP